MGMKKVSFNKPILVAIAAVIALAVIALVTSGERTLTWIEGTVGSVFQPIQTFSYKASTSIINFFENTFNTTDADKENEQLKAQIAQYEAMLSEPETVRAENERLRDLLNYSATFDNAETVAAQIIGKSQYAYFETFTINAGRNKGVEKGMPVVNSAGLIGRVTEVGATWAKVTCIIDASSSVSVMVERTRDYAMARGVMSTSAANNVLELYYLPTESDLVPGDVILTDGNGGLFPKGIVVGTVSEVMLTADGSSEVNAIIKPAVDFGHLEEVLIIISAEDGE